MKTDDGNNTAPDDNDSNWEDGSEIPENENDVIYLDDEEMKAYDESSEEEEQQPTNEEKSDEEFEDEEEEEKFAEGEKKTYEDNSSMQYKLHKDFVVAVRFNPKNKNIFAAGSGDDTGSVWNLDKPDSSLFVIKNQKETIDHIKFNVEGDLLATGCLDGALNVWKAEDGSLKSVLEGPTDEIRFLDWHSKGNAIAAGCADNSVWIWNANNGKYMASFFGHEKPVTDGGFTPDGKLLASASEDASLRIWKPQTAELLYKIQGFGFHEGMITKIAFHPTAQLILSGSLDKTACLSSYTNGKSVGRTSAHGGSVEVVEFNKNLECFYTGSLDGKIRVFDTSKVSQKEEFSFDVNKSAITKLMFLPDTNHVIASTKFGTLNFFDPRSNEKPFVCTAPSMIHDFDHNGNFAVVAGCEDGVLRRYDLKKLT